MKKMTTSSEPETSEISEESRRRAAAADAADRPIEPEIVEEIPGEQKFEDEQLHAVIVEVLRGAVLWVNQSRQWEGVPNEQWHQSTARLTEIVIAKWVGALQATPELLLGFNIGMLWILPNLLAEIERAKAKKAAEKTPDQKAAAA